MRRHSAAVFMAVFSCVAAVMQDRVGAEETLGTHSGGEHQETFRVAYRGCPESRQSSGSGGITFAGGLATLFQHPLHGVPRELRGILEVELLLDMFPIRLYRRWAETQTFGNLLRP